MPSELVPETSPSLLAQFCNAANPLEEQQAWNKFMDLYLRVVTVWARKYELPKERLPDLPGTLVMKLHGALKRWQSRAWLRSLMAEAADQWAVVLQRADWDGDRIRKAILDSVPREDWSALERIRRYFDVRNSPSAESSSREQMLRDWLRPTLSTWLKRQEVAIDLQEQLIVTFLEQVRQAALSTDKSRLPAFHSWLHIVVLNAVKDTLREIRDEKLQAGNQRYSILENEAARDELARTLQVREIYEALELQLQKRGVSARDWQIYRDYQIDNMTAPEVAARHNDKVSDQEKISVNNVYKIRERVHPIVQEAFRDMELN